MKWKELINNSLHIVFVGLNPGIRSFETQCFYAHPSNRFWKLLHEAGFTSRQLPPEDYAELLTWNIGLLDLVSRPTLSGNELSPREFRTGREKLIATAKSYQPLWLAANGLSVGRWLSGDKKIFEYGEWGVLPDTTIRLWVLPSSSGRAAKHQGKSFTYADKLREWKRFHDSVCPPTV
ncbi:MAG: mismatch-specific DNA-glycosylase [bacterium]|nr:mismatch-specific DNA-glycosylase [bacterium]